MNYHEMDKAVAEIIKESEWWVENGENIALHPKCYKPGEIHARVVKLRIALSKARGEDSK